MADIDWGELASTICREHGVDTQMFRYEVDKLRARLEKELEKAYRLGQLSVQPNELKLVKGNG